MTVTIAVVMNLDRMIAASSSFVRSRARVLLCLRALLLCALGLLLSYFLPSSVLSLIARPSALRSQQLDNDTLSLSFWLHFTSYSVFVRKEVCLAFAPLHEPILLVQQGET